MIKTQPCSSAFPTSEEQTVGLTKREYFAAIALQGILAGRMADSEVSDQDWAEWAVKLADELVAALNKTEQKPEREERTFKLEPLEPAPWDEAVESFDGFHGWYDGIGYDL